MSYFTSCCYLRYEASPGRPTVQRHAHRADIFSDACQVGSCARDSIESARWAGSASVLTTHALFARKVQRKLSNGRWLCRRADHLLNERDRGQIAPSRRRRVMANGGAERLLKIPAEPSPELRIPALQLKREWSPWPGRLMLTVLSGLTEFEQTRARQGCSDAN